MNPHDADVIVAGAGPAGLSAALMLGRARRRVLVIDAGSPRNRFAAHMHGVLGNEGTPPADLLARGRAEVAGYGVEFSAAVIERVDRSPGGLTVSTSDGRSRTARALIAATGPARRPPGDPGPCRAVGNLGASLPLLPRLGGSRLRLGVLTTSPLSLHQAELVRQWTDRLTVFSAGLGPLPVEVERRLKARGIDLISEPVREIRGEGTALSAVRLESGTEVALDAIFTGGVPRPLDDFLASLELDRAEGPFGSFLRVDVAGRTSDERIWAAGNVVNPGANVPKSMGDGAMTGAAVNGALVSWDFDDALARVAGGETRYSTSSLSAYQRASSS